MIDDLVKELNEIVTKERENEIIPFLQRLSFKEKKALVPSIKVLAKEILTRHQIEEKKGEYSSWSLKYFSTPKQRDVLTKACFVCYNKTDFKKEFWNSVEIITSDEYLEKIIPWYVPKWYDIIVNEEPSWALEYSKMMFLSQKGLIVLSQNLIITKLPTAIIKYERKNEKQISFYFPEVLEEYLETLDSHIWMLFEEESTINNYYNYNHLVNYDKGNDIWIDTFINLIESKKIDRKKLIQATIFTSTKGFNQSLSGWFFDLLIKLNPTNEEILEFQNELFSALNSPHSKVVNSVLRFFKKVANLKGFNQKVYIDNCSILLNSETKSVVNSALMMLDKIAKSNKKFEEEICLKATEALLNIDDKIQLRASKIIHKYGKTKSIELKNEINLYADTLFYSSKELLTEFFVDSETIFLEEEKEITTKILSDSNRVEVYKTFDELLFFVSQVLDNNEVHHIDLLLSYLPKLNLLIKQENVSKLEPIFKRALDLTFTFDGWNSQIGQLEFEAAYYLNDYAEILMKKFTKELQNFKAYKKDKIEKLKAERFFKRFNNNLKEIEQQGVHKPIYHIHHSLFISSKNLIKQNSDLSFLSTPTHFPCWVSLHILVDRIKAYEKSAFKINPNDLQIAIARLPINEFDETILNKIDEIQTLEIREILKYCYDLLPIKEANIYRTDIWMQAVVCKKNKEDIDYFKENSSYSLVKELTKYQWNCRIEDSIIKIYDYSNRKFINKTIQKKEIRFFNHKEKETLLEKVKVFFVPKKSLKIISIYNHIRFNKREYETVITPKDDVRFLNLAPNNPEVFLQEVVKHLLSESSFQSESSKKNMVNILKGLFNIWSRKDYQESVYLFLAASFLCSDKVSRELAAEIFIKAVSEDNFNTQLFGDILGKLQYNEYAPFKRFTDLLTLNLFNISKKHNKNILIFLDAMIKNMNDAPLRNSKKLVDILIELKLGFKNYEFNSDTKSKLLEWSKTKSLNVTINKIL